MESHLHKDLDNAIGLVTVIAAPVNGRSPFLAAFLCLKDDAKSREEQKAPSSKNISMGQASDYFLTATHYIPLTDNELQMQRLWAAIMGVQSYLSNEGVKLSHFPCINSGYQPQPGAVAIKDTNKLVREANSAYRISNIIRIAWAIAISNYSNPNEVIFGEVLTGRTGSSIDLTRVFGPKLATIPVRTTLDHQGIALGLLKEVQAKMIQIIPFEQIGLSNIQRLGEGPNKAFQFHNILVMQPRENSDIDSPFM
ncbi:hypothetical protein ACHAO1_006234 [Botrytis cinerea]